jgi:disulfide bond formation protein DsbB
MADRISLDRPIARDRRTALAAALAIGMALVVGGALAFEHIGGYIPCALCLQQRTPYYVGIPVALLALLSATMRWPAMVTRALFLIAAALMAYGAGLGAYHSGVEWGQHRRGQPAQ